MACPNKVTVKAYLTSEEHQTVARMADQAGLSVSGFVRAACMGAEIKGTADREAVTALLQVKGDLGRLGGLLKMALGEKVIDRAGGNELLKGLEETRRLLQVKLEALC